MLHLVTNTALTNAMKDLEMNELVQRIDAHRDAERRVGLLPHLGVCPVIPLIGSVDNRVEGGVDFPAFQDVLGLLVCLVADRAGIRPRRGDQEVEGLHPGVPGTLCHDVKELPVWLGVQLIKNHAVDVEAMLGVGRKTYDVWCPPNGRGPRKYTAHMGEGLLDGLTTYTVDTKETITAEAVEDDTSDAASQDTPPVTQQMLNNNPTFFNINISGGNNNFYQHVDKLTINNGGKQDE